MLPSNAERIGGIVSFNLENDSSAKSFPSPPASPGSQTDSGIASSGTISLVDRTVLHGIDRVILCTGYIHTLPFLSSYHRDTLPPSVADDTCLVTDGTQFHNLHKDIFYIPDPTLAFIGVPYYTATFSLFEFQAIALAKVWSGKAEMPGEKEMREEYKEKVGRLGTGRTFHSLLGKEEEYVGELLEWVNKGIPEGERVTGHSEVWRVKSKDIRARREKMLEQAKTRALERKGGVGAGGEAEL
jgi:ACS family pantothenate transporter-like MFS transporter